MGKFEVSLSGLQSNSNELERIAASLGRIASSLNSTGVGQFSSRAQGSIARAASKLCGYKSTVSQMAGAVGTIRHCYSNAENSAVYGSKALQNLFGAVSALGQSGTALLDGIRARELPDVDMNEILEEVLKGPISTGRNHPQTQAGIAWTEGVEELAKEHSIPWNEILGGLSDFDWSENFDELMKAKPYIVSTVLAGISPVANILYISSGLANGNDITFKDSTRTVKADAYADWLGYELDDDHPGVTAWLGKASAEAQNEWAYAGVNGYLGKTSADANAGFNFMEKKKTKEYKDGKWVEKETMEFISAEAGASAGVSILAADAKAGVGNDMLGAGVQGEGSVGNAKVGAKGQFSVSEDGIDANVSGEAMVSAAEGEVSGTINILGLEITGKIGGYAGALGVEGKAGIEDNKWVCEGGVAALFGVSAGIEIGFNDEGWDNFVDFVTFWD